MAPRSTLTVFSLAVALAASLPAQGRRGGFQRRPPMSPVLQVLDKDGDGALSANEIDAAVEAALGLDRNQDRNLTSDELPPPRGGRGGRGGPGGPGFGPPGGPGGPGGFGPPPGGPGGPGGFGSDPLMRALDKDGDGELFLDEVTDAAKSLRSLDADGDGALSPEEMRPEGGGPGRGGFGPGGPGGFGGRGARPGGEGGPAYDRVPMPEELRPEDGVATVPDRATFQALSYQGQEVMIDTHLADWEFVKFQIEGADGDEPRLYFMNTKTHRAHPMFMQTIGLGGGRGFGGPGGPGGDASGARMRGVLVYRPMLRSPSGQPGLYTFEFEPNDAYAYDLIRVAFDELCEHAPILRGNLAYNLLPRAAQQYETEKDRYADGDLPVFWPDEVNGDVAFLPLHQAESFGRLRLMGPADRPSVRDVVVYRTLPNEMPRVAGVLTACRQTPLSHVNLRAVQDDVPNAFVLGIADDPGVQALEGKYVRLAVTASGYELRAATNDEVDAHFASIRPAEGQTPPRDLTVREVRAFADVAFGDSAAFGVKSSNLATLGTLGLGEGRTPSGFAVPLSFYDEFMKHNGFYDMAREMMATADFEADADVRERALAKFRKTLRKGAIPAWMHDALGAVQAQFADGVSIRCRSSTNNEDLPGFSGAGLYDSYTHKPDEGHLEETVRKVFASLWNFRAFEEREFHRIDHLQAAMGVVLHPNQKREQVNGVAVTRDVLYQDQHKDMVLYYVNAQVGEDLVTNPEDESVPEELLLSPRNPKRDRLVQRSNRATGEEPVLGERHRQELRDALRILHDRFAELYGRQGDSAFGMEIEFKVTEDGVLLIKQARPWIG